MKWSHIETWFTTIALVTTFCMLSLGSWWFIFEPETIIYDMKDDRPLQSVIIAGQTLKISRSYCVLPGKPVGRVQRHIENGVIYLLPETTTPNHPGCGVRIFQVEIPHTLYPGTYVYKARILYQLNPIRTVTVNLPDVPFKVENPLFQNDK
jgi:hypothetical protein